MIEIFNFSKQEFVNSVDCIFPFPCLFAPRVQIGIDKDKKSTRFWEWCIIGWKYTGAENRQIPESGFRAQSPAALIIDTWYSRCICTLSVLVRSVATTTSNPLVLLRKQLLMDLSSDYCARRVLSGWVIDKKRSYWCILHEHFSSDFSWFFLVGNDWSSRRSGPAGKIIEISIIQAKRL